MSTPFQIVTDNDAKIFHMMRLEKGYVIESDRCNILRRAKNQQRFSGIEAHAIACSPTCAGVKVTLKLGEI